MNLYEIYQIDESIRNLVDEESGEILDYEAFAALTMEREKKVENMALWYLDLNAQIAAIKAEEDRLYARRKEAENMQDKLKDYLAQMQAGEKFNTPRVSISFRSSEAVEIADEKAFVKAMMESGFDSYLTYKEPTINRTAIKNALKGGVAIEGAVIKKKQNIQIK
jgi:predicted  nucleic acid-binding Zn-ribbon protein